MELAADFFMGCAVLLPGFAPIALVVYLCLDHLRTIDREDTAKADYERELADAAEAQRKRMEQLQ